MEAPQTIRGVGWGRVFIFKGKIDKIYSSSNTKEQFYRDEVKTG